MEAYRHKLRELFGIDIRSLALFRVAIASVILFDLFNRARDLVAHYTDSGILPRDLLINNEIYKEFISLHLANGAWPFQIFLFTVAIVCALALLLGYRTRLAASLSWLLLISLQSRNPMIGQGGDVVLRLLLFWGLFLPMGACWSIDRLLQKDPGPSTQVVSGGTFGVLLQVCFIYWFAVLLKTHESWLSEGSAVWYALNIGQFTTPLGYYLLEYPHLLKIATFSTLALEAFGPFFAFSPFWTGPLRFATVAVFLIFHLIFLNLTMELGIFPYICAVAWLLFIPEWFWNHVLHLKEPIATYTWKASRLSNGIALFFVVYIFLWNVRSVGVAIPFAQFNTLGFIARVDQYWNMFSPFPTIRDGWYVIPGTLRDGTEVDLFNEGSVVSWEKPLLVSGVYKSDRWRAYMLNLLFSENNGAYLRSYAWYLASKWNAEHPKERAVVALDIVFMMKTNTWMGPPSPPKRACLWHHHFYSGT